MDSLFLRWNLFTFMSSFLPPLYEFSYIHRFFKDLIRLEWPKIGKIGTFLKMFSTDLKST